MINKTICNRYKILDHLGTGGMATVWLAEDTILNRKVAIKTFKIDPSDKDAIKRFDREANAVTSLSHNNIVSIYGVENEENFHYLILEYVEGMTLKDYMMNNENISFEIAVNIMKQIADALSHAHKNGIIHRDIKPQNILMTQDMVCKITDFGISRTYGDTTMTQTNQMLGTVYYLSPEQARGNVATAQSDIYSFGILFFELLTGKIPFKGESAVAIALKHLQEELPNIDKYRDGVPNSLKNIIIKATMKNPNERYLNSKELVDDIVTCLDEERLNETTYKGFSKISLPSDPQPKIVKVYNEPKEKIEIAKPIQTYENISNKVPKKKSSFGKVFLSLLIVLAAVVAIFYTYNYYVTTNKIVAPDVRNLSIDDAKSKITNAGLEVGEITEVASTSIEKNTVISSDPSQGKKVSKGTKVNLKVSSGNNTIDMPNYIGMKEEDVRESVSKLGLKNLIIEKENSDTYKEGLVIGQSVKAGQEITPSEISLVITVSSGTKEIAVPDLRGMSLSEVYALADNLGIKVKVSSNEYNDKYVENSIISQQPTASNTIKKGEEVAVIVSKGKNPANEEINVINFSGKTLVDIENWANENGINLSIYYETSTKASDTILSQNPKTGKIKKNSSITVTVAK